MRHPQLSRSESDNAEIGRKTAVASMSPAWVPASVKLLKKALLFAGACSMVIDVAPDCSPETARPWQMRRRTRRIGAHTPIC
jgi:hypothetical protein